MPPLPPGYGASGPAAPEPAAVAPAPPPPGDKHGRLLSAVVGGIVGAVVAALVASGLVLATDDDPSPRAGGEPTTATSSPGSGLGVGDSLDIQQLLDLTQPTVVSIYTQVAEGAGAGSGFVFDAEEGLILTNAHVVEGAEEISVTFFDGSAQGADLVGAFPEDDLAMIRVIDVDGLRASVLGSSDDLEVGEDVVAIGNALGLGGRPTVTTGIVSAKDRTVPVDNGYTLTGLIQTDAAINRGNSGGPLLNSRGEVVGINSAVAAAGQNIGFALAIDNILPLIEDLRAGRGEDPAEQAFLGVTTVPATDPSIPPEILDQFQITDLDGLIVSDVTPDSAADDAGFEVGDVILSADGQVVTENAELGEIIRSKAPGDRIEIEYERMGEPATVSVELKRRGG